MHNNGTDVWVVTHEWNSDAFYAYLITSTGINSTAVVSNSGSYIGGNPNVFSYYMGYIKISPDGSKLAAVHHQQNEVQLFSFDNSNGSISNPIMIQDNYQGNGPYGCEFSPSSEILYVSTSLASGYIHQYDLTASNINASELLITTMPSVGSQFQIGLQLGPDNKIYSTRNGSTIPFGGYPNLSVINSPDTLGIGCDFVLDQLFLAGKNANMGLPPLIVFPFTFTYDSLCYSNQTRFTCTNTNITQTSWSFGDPPSGSDNLASGNNVSHIFSTTGTFTVTMAGDINGIPKSFSKDVTILPTPQINLEDSIYLCKDSTVYLDASIINGTYLWSDNSTLSSLTIKNPGAYSINVTDSNGCESNKNIEILTEECGDKTVYLPSAFSPNGDGVNDILYVRGTGISSIELLIYNRFGEVVFKSENINNGWDGTFREKNLKSDVFIVNLNTIFYDGEQKQLSGNLSLLK
jgi:gliding motility-associated-like protein